MTNFVCNLSDANKNSLASDMISIWYEEVRERLYVTGKWYEQMNIKMFTFWFELLKTVHKTKQRQKFIGT